MKNESILSAKNISKSYFMAESLELKVLESVNLEIYKGEIVSVIGESGVGKSTLLHVLGTLDKPEQGELFLNDTEVFAMNGNEIDSFRNRTVGFIFQFHHLLPEFSALENVAMPGLIARIDSKEVYEKAEELLVEVGLKERMKHKPSELSGGEKQRVAFARALVNDPVIVLADEPTGNLDTVNSAVVREQMWELVRQKNKAFVVATHNRNIAKYSDRVLEIKNKAVLEIDKESV